MLNMHTFRLILWQPKVQRNRNYRVHKKNIIAIHDKTPLQSMRSAYCVISSSLRVGSRMRVSLGDTSAYRSLQLPADLCRSVSHSTLDITRRRGIGPLQGPPPGRPARTDTPPAISLGISGSPRFLSREEAKFVWKFLLLNWEVGLAHNMCHASNTASQRVRSAYPFVLGLPF